MLPHCCKMELYLQSSASCRSPPQGAQCLRLTDAQWPNPREARRWNGPHTRSANVKKNLCQVCCKTLHKSPAKRAWRVRCQHLKHGWRAPARSWKRSRGSGKYSSERIRSLSSSSRVRSGSESFIQDAAALQNPSMA